MIHCLLLLDGVSMLRYRCIDISVIMFLLCVDIVRMSAHVVKTSSVRSLQNVLMSSNYESFEFDFESDLRVFSIAA